MRPPSKLNSRQNPPPPYPEKNSGSTHVKTIHYLIYVAN